jgi:hypothetical protein
MQPTAPQLNTKATRLIVCVSLCLGPVGAHAADALATDRPDFVESSQVVDQGQFQLETGMSWERTKAEGQTSRTRTTPSLLRMGIADALELRLETDGFATEKTRLPDGGAGRNERGFSDASVGLKWRQQEADADNGRPGVAWLLHADLDSGTKAFRGAGVRPSVRMVAEWELPNGMSLGVMPGLAGDRDEADRRFVAGVLAATLGQTWTPKWRSFVELAGQRLTSKAHGGSVVTFDVGAAYLVSDDLQIDVSAAQGVSHAAPDLQWGLGLSIRF